MKLKVLLPKEVFLDQEVTKVTAEAENGSFCILPRHIDFVAGLVPGILSFVSNEGREVFLAINEGILIKCGPEVMISTINAVQDKELGRLKKLVDEQFRVLDDREKKARSALTKLEADFVRRFLEMR